jgi:L-amino acid N-acyltransferase YncA
MDELFNVHAYPRTVMLRDGATVSLRPLEAEDKLRLLDFFKRVPEEERYYLKENVTAPEVIQAWTSHIDFDRVISIVAEAGEDIVADATLHRSRAPARRHIGELRIVVDPAFREVGLGRRLIRELLDISAELGLSQATFELVADRERPAINAAQSVGFRPSATLKGRIKDYWGNYQDLVLLEMPLNERHMWWF